MFLANSGRFVIVIEAIKGTSQLALAQFPLQPNDVDDRPDLWIESTQNLGNGSPAICDTGPVSSGGGGVPGINPPNFAPEPTPTFVTNALNDFACRFDPGVNVNAPCTLTDSTRDPKLITPGASIQFCDFVASNATFPPGEAVLTARLRDMGGNLGPTAQIVVRVPTPTR